MASKRVALIAVSALVMGLLPFGAVSAQAADLGTIAIDCDFGDIAGATIVATGGIGDTFVINNTGAADNCVISPTDLLTGEEAAGGVVLPGATSGTITIVNSGTFTISSSGTGTPARSFVIDACSLVGAGVAASPWQVANLADLSIVGYNGVVGSYNNSCSPSGHYLQTANIPNVDLAVGSGAQNPRVSGVVFTGTYDGDHYNIAFDSSANNGAFRGREPLFSELGPGGVIRKLSLSGNIRNNKTESSSLVRELYGGTISEVRSTVLIQVDDDNDAVIGGLAARSGGANQTGLIIYSSFSGRIEWLESISGARQEGPVIGGLVGMAQEANGTTEIRDSYSRAAISFNSGGLTPNAGSTHRAAAVFAGGLVGSDGLTSINDGGNNTTTFNANNRTHDASSVSIIRSYFAGSFANTCVGSAAECNTDSPSHVFTGGLIGVSEGRDDTGDRMVSSFWLSTSATNAIGGILLTVADPLVYGATQPLDYTGSSPFLPEAPGLSAANLRTLSTYQTSELQTPSNSGLPGGAEIVQADSGEAGSGDTRAATAPDYRWAIEPGNQVGFVATDYRDVANFASRKLFPDPVLAATYQTRGVVETVSGYPRLGRVWEICANENNGFPVLVWEQRDCAGPGGGGDSGGNPGGLSDAEYAEFLRSGLTLADFLARRLAATGPSDAALGLGGLSAVLLGLVGAALVLIARRQVSRKSR